MKVVAINGSPRMENGNTAPILNSFLDGMREAGASIELFYAKKLDVRPCTGEFSCWGKTDGKCHIKDDMQMLVRKLGAADIWVWGIPIYVPMPGEMQNIINRLMPLFDSRVTIKDGCMYPHRRDEVKLRNIVLVSSSSFWQMENFNDLQRIIERVSKILDAKPHYLLRPQADLLKSHLKKSGDHNNILASTEDAGRQLITKGSISNKTLSIISKPLLPMKSFLADFEVV